MIFGGFLEHFYDQVYGGVFDHGSPLADERGFRNDVIAAMKELKLSVVAGRAAVSPAAITGRTASGRIASRFPIRSGA